MAKKQQDPEIVVIPRHSWKHIQDLDSVVAEFRPQVQKAQEDFNNKLQEYQMMQTRLRTFADGVASALGVSLDTHRIEAGEFIPYTEDELDQIAKMAQAQQVVDDSAEDSLSTEKEVVSA